MKKNQRLFALSLCLFLLCGCGIQEKAEVKYAEGLETRTKVYEEVLSFIPSYNVYSTSLGNLTNGSITHVICNCYTVDGDYVWVSVPVSDYKKDIDPDYSTEYHMIGNEVDDPIIFDVPRTIHGTITASNKIQDELAENVGETVFAYSGIDPADEPQATPEAPLSEGALHGDRIYVDILAIDPVVGIGKEGTFFTGEYTSLLCACLGSEGDVFYLFIPGKTYQSVFDPDISLSSIYANYDTSDDMIFFADGRRIHGIVHKTAAMFTEDVGLGDTFVTFVSADD